MSNSEMKEALEAIAEALDVGRNRFGRVEVTMQRGAPLQRLAVKYQVGGAEDVVHQIRLVALAVLAKAEGRS